MSEVEMEFDCFSFACPVMDCPESFRLCERCGRCENHCRHKEFIPVAMITIEDDCSPSGEPYQPKNQREMF